MSFTPGQEISLALMPKIMSSISLVGSVMIVFTVLRDPKKRCKTYHRLLAGISFADCITNISTGILSTWPIPADSGVRWAAGNDRTCQAQGFFVQANCTSAMYNACLSLYYLLTIKYRWTEDRLKKIEPYLHAIPFLWSYSTAIASISLDILGNAYLWCWISSKYDAYRWALFYGPLWLMILIVTINCIMIWLHIRKTERKSNRWTFEATSLRIKQSTPFRISTANNNVNGVAEGAKKKPKQPSQSRQVANQCFLYAAAFYFNWVGITVRLKRAVAFVSYVVMRCCASRARTSNAGGLSFVVSIASRLPSSYC